MAESSLTRWYSKYVENYHPIPQKEILDTI